MNTRTLSLQTGARPLDTSRLSHWLRYVNSIPCLALTILVSAAPPFGLVLLAAWASNNAIALPVVQAALGLGGLVFLALALDAGRRTAILLAATALALFALSWASVSVSIELVIVAAMLTAAWLGAASFRLVRQYCL